MRYIILFATLILSACASKQELVNDAQLIESEITKRFNSLVEAAKTLDTDDYFNHFDKHRFTALNENGTVTHSFIGFQNNYLTGVESVENYQSLEFRNVKVSVINPRTAILVNEYKATIMLNTGSVVNFSGAGTQVWHKSDEIWKLVSVSSSAATPL